MDFLFDDKGHTYIGAQAMGDVCSDSLEDFKLDRQDDGVKNATINRSLEVGPHGVEPRGARLARCRQALVVGAAADRNAGRGWAEARAVSGVGSARARAEAQRFVILPEHFKTNRKHVLILNDTAWHIVQRHRGCHDKFVFVYRRERTVHVDQAPLMEYHRVGTMNNAAFQRARAEAGLAKFRIPDARHIFGQRLRDAGVSGEDGALLLGHAIDDMPSHYASATVARLVEAANSVTRTRDRMTLLRVAIG